METHQNLVFFYKMVLECYEREHEDVDRAIQGNMVSQQALRACRLYKLWHLDSLIAKPRLLQLLVDYWDLDFETFHIDGMSLNIEVEDIYFITSLSCRGEVVNLRSRGLGGGLTID